MADCHLHDGHDLDDSRAGRPMEGPAGSDTRWRRKGLDGAGHVGGVAGRGDLSGDGEWMIFDLGNIDDDKWDDGEFREAETDLRGGGGKITARKGG